MLEKQRRKGPQESNSGHSALEGAYGLLKIQRGKLPALVPSLSSTKSTSTWKPTDTSHMPPTHPDKQNTGDRSRKWQDQPACEAKPQLPHFLETLKQKKIKQLFDQK